MGVLGNVGPCGLGESLRQEMPGHPAQEDHFTSTANSFISIKVLLRQKGENKTLHKTKNKQTSKTYTNIRTSNFFKFIFPTPQPPKLTLKKNPKEIEMLASKIFIQKVRHPLYKTIVMERRWQRNEKEGIRWSVDL